VVDPTTGDLTLSVNPTGIVGTQVYPVVVSAPNSNVTRTVAVTLSAAPTIALSATDLAFQAIRGSTTDLVKTVKVSNAGNGVLGGITCPATPTVWLTCTVAADVLTFTAKPGGLLASPPEVVVPVMAVGAFNNPQNVTVNLAILQPVLSLNTNVVNATVVAPATSAPAVVTFANTGAGTTADLGTIACTPNPADTHITCVVDLAARTLTLTVNTATAPALAVGKHVLPVTVTASNAVNASQPITIVLTVN